MKLVLLIASCVVYAFTGLTAALAQSPANEQNADNVIVDFFDSQIPDTIMFTIDELNEIQTRESGGEITGLEYRSGAIEDANLFLSSIVYFSPEEWVFWLNGVQVNPQSRFDTFDVVGVRPDYIDLIVPLSAAGVRPIRLEPNQTFIGDNGRVVEGAFN